MAIANKKPDKKNKVTKTNPTGGGRKPGPLAAKDSISTLAVNQRLRYAMNRKFLEESEKALTTLTSIMSNEEAEDADRIKAAKEVLDRGMGKIIQSHELSGPNGTPMQMQTQVADLSGMPATDLKQLETLLAKTVLAQHDKSNSMIDITAEAVG